MQLGSVDKVNLITTECYITCLYSIYRLTMKGSGDVLCLGPVYLVVFVVLIVFVDVISGLCYAFHRSS